MLVRKMPNATLAAVDDEAFEQLKRIKTGAEVAVTIKRTRNPKFHRKFFALCKLAFDYWEPAPVPVDPESRWLKDAKPQKNFERFRKDLIILAGHYQAFYRINGEVRIEAKSVSFAAMPESEFETLYSATIDVIIRHVLPSMSDAEIRAMVESMVLEYV